MKTETWIAAYDLHYPKVNWRTFHAMMSFIKQNGCSGFLFGGDQFDNECISHHTQGKPLYRRKGAYAFDEKGFENGILTPLETVLGSKPEKIWLVGNHDDWEYQLVEREPQFDGVIDRVASLKLIERGWKVVTIGRSFRHGKLTFIHGDQLTGMGNQAPMYHAKKAVEAFCQNVLYGHTHSPQSFTKILPVNQTQKWMAYCAPILGNTNPGYLRNRPTSWLNGFVIVEFHKAGNFNCYPVVVSDGRFSYGGKVYSEGD